jgi:predicted Rossmann-fold nucleotide-binding protein
MALSVAVYCGSRFGDRPAYTHAACALGRLLAEAGGCVIYGGGRVIPQALMDREVGHAGLTELHVVQTMHERKQLMAERADAFIALPGGIGTLEEIYEVWSWQQLGYHDKPVALLNVAGYYDALLEFMRVSHERGFVSAPQYHALLVDDDPARLLDRIGQAAAKATARDDYSKI